MNEQAVEWAPFRLRANVAEAELLVASDAMQAGFLAAQKGFVRRELLRRDDRNFVDLVWWESHEVAAAAMQAAMKSSHCAAYFSLMHFDAPPDQQVGAGVLHLARLATYGPQP